MSNAFRVLSAVAALFAAAIPAFANEHWTLVQAVGEVSVAAPGAAPVSAKPSTPLPDGATVRTGETGRAVLLRGRESIVMSPSSALTLPKSGKRDVTKVKQLTGTLLFKIGKKPEAHFEVDTPYLAAVVKGTTFTVKVGSAAASVHVLEGAVEVATSDRKSSFLTRAGQISTVFAKAMGDIFTSGAAQLNSPANSNELWGVDTSGGDAGGVSAWSLATESRVYGDTGLKAHTSKPRHREPLSVRAPERMTEAAKSVNETMGAAKSRNQTQKPKDGSVRAQGDTDQARDRAQKDDERTSAAAKKPERKAHAPNTPKQTELAPKAANVWTVTQTRGEIKIDGYPFTNFGDGQVRTLPPGTRIETGPDSRLGVAHAMKEFVFEENTLAVLSDAINAEPPKVVEGQAVQYQEASGRYVAVANLSPEEAAKLKASGALDAASPDAPGGGGVDLAAPGMSGQTASAGPSLPAPKIVSLPSYGNSKTEEVRTKVIGSLTLGLYGLTAALVLAFGAQWGWRRYKAKAKEPQAETAAQVRLRTIKGT